MASSSTVDATLYRLGSTHVFSNLFVSRRLLCFLWRRQCGEFAFFNGWTELLLPLRTAESGKLVSLEEAESYFEQDSFEHTGTASK
jgi:hypothetical protein